MTREKLVRHMVGRDITQTHYARQRDGSRRHHSTEKVLTVENVTMGVVVKNMSFSVYAGEVVGIAGLIGSGRTEIAKIVYGALEAQPDQRRHDLPARQADPLPRAEAGDQRRHLLHHRGPQAQRLLRDHAHRRQHLCRASLRPRPAGAFCVSRFVRNKLANYWIERLKIAALQRKARIVELSGGNQQKVVIAKSLAQDPSIVIFDEPTRGVDVGTIPEIHAQIRRLADEGKAVVVISSYLPEILAVSDRILVARLGRIVAEFDAATATEDKIMYAAIH